MPIVNGSTTRSAFAEKFRLNDTPNTFIGDATKLWNLAPCELKNAKTLSQLAKSITKKFCSTLPM